MGLRHVWVEWGCGTCGQNGATRVGRVGRHVCAEWVRVGEQERKNQASPLVAVDNVLGRVRVADPLLE